jgi:hypothetical protein
MKTSARRFLANDIYDSKGAKNSSAKYAFGYQFDNKTIVSLKLTSANANDPTRLIMIVGISVVILLFIGLILYFAIKCRQKLLREEELMDLEA